MRITLHVALGRPLHVTSEFLPRSVAGPMGISHSSGSTAGSLSIAWAECIRTHSPSVDLANLVTANGTTVTATSTSTGTSTSNPLLISTEQDKKNNGMWPLPRGQ